MDTALRLQPSECQVPTLGFVREVLKGNQIPLRCMYEGVMRLEPSRGRD